MRIRYGVLGICAAILVWQGATLLVGSSLILPGPLEVLRSLARLGYSPGFWMAVLGSFKRVILAFLLSMGIGALSGILAALSAKFKAFMAPFLTITRATPVLALILIAMFWLPSSGVPVFTAFLMAYPLMHTSVCMGMESVDPELLEMAAVFKVPRKNVLFKLKLPSAAPHFLSGATNALGLSWKVVVAGEVLSQPLRALGTGMQDARLSLDSASVLAWAAATVFFCGVSEFLLGMATRSLEKARREKSHD